MIIIVYLLSLFIDCLLSDQILKRNLGQDVTLSCIFPNQSQIEQVSFMHQTTGDILSLGLEIFVDENMKLILFSSNRLDLQISSLNQNNSGLYSCMFNDEILSSYLLEIFIPPRFVSFFPMEASVTYPEGSSMNLSCRALAVPSANISWIYRNKNKQFKIIHNGEDVYISSIEYRDSGSYECIASNGYHVTISRSFYVTVQYPPRVKIDKHIDHLKRPIRLTCEICSMPLSHIRWFKNGNNTSDEQHFFIKSDIISIDNEQCIITILTILDSSDEKYGRYECHAENILGHNSDHIDFHSKYHLIPHPKSRNEHVSFYSSSDNVNQISDSSSSCVCNKYVLIIFSMMSLMC